jgi:hypothetical protein
MRPKAEALGYLMLAGVERLSSRGADGARLRSCADGERLGVVSASDRNECCARVGLARE